MSSLWEFRLVSGSRHRNLADVRMPSLVYCIMAETPFFLFCHSPHLSLRRKKGCMCFKEIPGSLPGSDEDCRPIERN